VVGCFSTDTVDVRLYFYDSWFFERIDASLVPAERRFPNSVVWFDVQKDGSLVFVEPETEELPSDGRLGESKSRWTFSPDADTARLFDVIAWCLQRYFGHSEASAVGAINNYHELFEHQHQGDDFYHREGAYWVALRIHYVMDLHGDPNKFEDFRREKGITRPPEEAQEFFRKHYFDPPPPGS
jgi:hypothetical protein